MVPLVRFAVLSSLAVALISGAPAGATVFHQVKLEFDDDLDPFNGVFDRAFDSLRVPTPADVDRSLLASLNASGYSALGSVGLFGALGVTGFHFDPGRLETQVVISDDAIANPFSVPMRAVASFIIDGGIFDLIAGSSDPTMPASLEWQLDVFSDALGGVFGPHFQSFLTLESDDFTNVTLSGGGAPVGAFKTTPGGTRVEMPFSFQSLDLGTIPGGGVIDLQYVMGIRTRAEVAEGVFFEFSDPLDVQGVSPFSVQFLPVPEPAALMGLLATAASLHSLRRRTRSG